MVSEGTDGTEQELSQGIWQSQDEAGVPGRYTNMDCEGNNRRIRLAAGRKFAGQDDKRTASGRSQGHRQEGRRESGQEGLTGQEGQRTSSGRREKEFADGLQQFKGMMQGAL